MTTPTLVDQLFHLLVAVAFVLFALRLITKIAGFGEKAVRQLVNGILEAVVSVLLLPLKAISWILARIFR